MQNSKIASEKPSCGQRMIYTGPDGVGDYRPRSNYFPLNIGVGATSPGATKDLNYLWRAAPNSHPLVARRRYVGEVGWGWQYNQQLNSDTLHSNMQIKKTEARVALEDQITQKFQNHQKNMIDDSQEVNTKLESTADGILPPTMHEEPDF